MRVCLPQPTTSVRGKPDQDLVLAAHFGLPEGIAMIHSEICEIVTECASAGLPSFATRARSLGEPCRERRSLRLMPAAVCFKITRRGVAGTG